MPDQIIDRDALIEKAKISIYNHVEDADWGNAYDAAAAALPVIVDAALAPIEALHSLNVVALLQFCRGCSGDWPCPTAQAVAAIREAVAK